MLIALSVPSRPAWKAEREMLPYWMFELRVREYE
jgi:hypothetical protein